MCYLIASITTIVNYLSADFLLSCVKEKIIDFDSLLSPLESDILKVLWPNKRLRVKEIFSKLKRKNVAHSSVAVICDRLHDKGLLKRDIEKTVKDCVRYVYFPVQDKINFEKSIVERTVNSLIASFGSTAISYFNERFKRGK